MVTVLAASPDADFAPSNTSTVYICTTYDQVVTNLGINVSVAASNPWGSFASKLKFARSLAMSSTSVTILAVAEIVMGTATPLRVDYIRAPATAKELYAEGGSSYVSSITTGAAYMAAYTFTAQNTESYESVIAAAEAQYSGMITDFSAEFSTNIERIEKSTSVSGLLKQDMVGIYDVAVPPPEGIVDFVRNFGTLHFSDPDVMDFGVKSYSGVAGGPDMAAIDVLVDDYTGDSGYSHMEQLTMGNLSAVKAVTSVYAAYGLGSYDPKLAQVTGELKRDLASMATWRKAVHHDPTVPNITPPTFAALDFGVPTAMYHLETGPLAGVTDVRFDDVSADMVQRGVHPSVIAMYSNGNEGYYLDRISTTYVDAGGKQVGQPAVHGQPARGYPPLELGPREEVSSVIMQYGKGGSGVDRVTIATNHGQTVSVPPEDGGWYNKTWTASPTSRFVGWAGYVGDGWVGGLCVRFVNFQLAEWDASRQPRKQAEPTGVAKQIKPTVVAPLERQPDFAQGHMPTNTEAIYVIQDWAVVNCDLIIRAYEQKGGWEGWAQVGMALAFQSTYRDLRVSREVNIFTSKKRADFVLSYHGEATQLFEIKCASSGQDRFSPTAPAFAKALQADIAKVMTNNIRGGYGTTVVTIVGISPNPRSYGAILSGAYDVPIHLAEIVKGRLWMWYGGFVKNAGGA
jgi:hypothetical protein